MESANDKKTLKGNWVLIVEDEERIRTLLEDTLRTRGLVTVSAENGEKGLKEFQSFLPGIVITDLMMPVMNGFSLIEKIREHPLGSKVHIIVMSAVYRDFKIKRNTQTQLGVDFLIKPFSLPDLLKLLKKVGPGKAKTTAYVPQAKPRSKPTGQSKGSDPWQGKLDFFSFPLVLVHFFSERKTGILELQSGQNQIKIYLEKGVPVFAEGRKRFIDRDSALKIMQQAFNWVSGTYRFVALASLSKDIPLHRYEFYRIIYEGAKHYYLLETLIEKFKDHQNHKVVRRPGFGTRIQLVGFNEVELSLVNQVNDQKTVSDLVSAGRDHFENVFQILWVLQFMDIIEFRK